MCSHNIPISIPSHPYVLTNRSILCNCDVEAESNFLLESLAACENSETKTELELYFTVDLAFLNYFDKVIEDLGIPILRNWKTQEQVLPFSVESFEINASLPTAPKTWKDLVKQYKNKKKILELQGHKDEERAKKSSKFGSFLNSFLAGILLFSAALVTVIIMLVVIYMVCGHNLYGMWTIKIENIGSKHSLTACHRNRNSRCKTPRHILCM